MNYKRAAEHDFYSDRKQRKRLSLELKLDVLKRLENGERQTDICKSLDLAGSTVRTILKNADKIKEYVKVAAPMDALRITRRRASAVVEMEKQLTGWIEESNRQCMPPTFSNIQEKAINLYNDLKKDFPDSSSVEPFTASRIWFKGFMKRTEMNVAISGDISCVDDQAAMNFKNELLGIILEGGYLPQQVFNVDETGLFWKRMPVKTNLSKEEKSVPGFKPSKDRLTLLLGSNASGDFKLKPMIVYHSETPKALKGYSKNCLPVIWRSNRKAWVTKQVFESWFTAYFCPTVKEYCAINNLDNKALLIVDTAPGHPTTLEDFGQNVKVVFLPPNTNTFLQPMDQGVITMFKACYTRCIMEQALRAIEGDDAQTLKDFWKAYNIRQAIECIVGAWDEISCRSMNDVWRNLWPDCVQDCVQGFDEVVDSVCDKIVELGRKLGYDELELHDVQELIHSHGEELTGEEFAELQKILMAENMSAEDEDLEPARTLTTTNLTEFFKNLDSALAVIYENDPNMQRSSSVARGINNLVNCYRELHNEKRTKRQISLDPFLYFFQNPSNSTSVVSSPSTEENHEIRPEKNDDVQRVLKVELQDDSS